MQDTDDELQEDLLAETEQERPSRRPILKLELPPDRLVLSDARTLVTDRNARITYLAHTVAQDPVTTLELLRVANATFFAADRPSICHPQTAVVRLGSKTVSQLLDNLALRKELPTVEEREELESLRLASRQTALVARIIAQMTNSDVAELAQTAGLLSFVGHMLACAYLGEVYVSEARIRKHTALVYYLSQYYHLDLNQIQLYYFRKNGVPQALFYAFDRELACKTTSQAALRFTVESAVELVEAFKDGRWDKYAPGSPLPAKSALRLLRVNEMQYEHIYDTIDSYLNYGDTEESAGYEDKSYSEEDEELTGEQDDDGLSEEGLYNPLTGEYEPDRDSEPAQRVSPTIVISRRRNGPGQPSMRSSSTVLLHRQDIEKLKPSNQPTNFLENSADTFEEEQQALSSDAQKVLGLISKLCHQCKNSQALLVNIMKLLISNGPFVRAALIVLQSDRSVAGIHTAVGEGFVEEDSISVKDPLSPLALCLTKIKSFNAKQYEDALSPFGVSAYAVSPIRVKTDEPVVLYADCGLDKPLPLESRRIFRLVVGLLNKTLPKLNGGLPERAVRRRGDTMVFDHEALTKSLNSEEL